MKSSDTAAPAPDSIEFRCNICGESNCRTAAEFGRERPSCTHCGSTVRARSIIRMLTRELINADAALPDLPVIRGIRGIGLSDFCFPARLAEKLNYTNTYYHKEPLFDVMNPAAEHLGAYDFLISSEVFEHVAPPVDTAFRNAHRVLKPNGVLLLTVPYTLEEKTTEHFPELHEYGLAQLGERTVLVNRTRDGQIQVFEDLCFHGGPGSTLEIRRFTEKDLQRIATDAGFLSVRIYGDDYRPFGIVHQETWSLPMAIRKEPYALSLAAVGELTLQWIARLQQAQRLEQQLSELAADFHNYQQWATTAAAQSERQLQERTEWARGIEAQFEERTAWALSLDKDLNHHVEVARQLEAENRERSEWGLRLQRELDELRSRMDATNRSLWTKAGRKLGLVK